MRRVAALIFLLAMALMLSLSAGDIEGRVVITREVTKKRLVVDLYAPRGGVSATSVAPEDPNEGGRTAVYIDAMFPPSTAPPTVQIAQKNRRFEREVLVIPVGASVSLPNGDAIFHNVFSLSKAKSFDLGYYSQGQARTVGSIKRVRCSYSVICTRI